MSRARTELASTSWAAALAWVLSTCPATTSVEVWLAFVLLDVVWFTLGWLARGWVDP